MCQNGDSYAIMKHNWNIK